VIGCHESLGGYLLPGFLPRVFEEEPKIGIRLWTASSADVTQGWFNARSTADWR
jgi:hypothetical protein